MSRSTAGAPRAFRSAPTTMTTDVSSRPRGRRSSGTRYSILVCNVVEVGSEAARIDRQAWRVLGSANGVAAKSGVVLIAVCAAFALPSCGGDGSKVFGESAEPCAPVLSQRDQAAVDDGADCFISEVSDGNVVVWDVMSWTDEGDPVPIRYEFDGDKVTITDGIRRGTATARAR